MEKCVRLDRQWMASPNPETRVKNDKRTVAPGPQKKKKKGKIKEEKMTKIKI